jgi:hypothetical protein
VFLACGSRRGTRQPCVSLSVRILLSRYGLNVMDIPVKSIPFLIFEEMWAPFFCFQYFRYDWQSGCAVIGRHAREAMAPQPAVPICVLVCLCVAVHVHGCECWPSQPARACFARICRGLPLLSLRACRPFHIPAWASHPGRHTAALSPLAPQHPGVDHRRRLLQLRGVHLGHHLVRRVSSCGSRPASPPQSPPLPFMLTDPPPSHPWTCHHGRHMRFHDRIVSPACVPGCFCVVPGSPSSRPPWRRTATCAAWRTLRASRGASQRKPTLQHCAYNRGRKAQGPGRSLRPQLASIASRTALALHLCPKPP